MFTFDLSPFQDDAVAVFAAFLRIGPAIALSPGYSESFVSIRIKLFVALAVSAALAPALELDQQLRDASVAQTLLIFARETLVGLALGLVARSTLFVVQIVGALISHATSLSHIFGTDMNASPIYTNLLSYAAIALIYTTPLAQMQLYLITTSYTFELSAALSSMSSLAQTFVTLFSGSYNMAVNLMAGFIAFILIFYLGLGIINRVWPALPVTLIAMPAIIMLILIILMWSGEDLLRAWLEIAARILSLEFWGPR